PEVVALLLDRGADIEARNYDGPTEVSWRGLFAKALVAVLAVSFEVTLGLVFGIEPDGETLEVLSEFPDVIFHLGGIAPLHAAAGYNKPEVVALLLDRGADINALSSFGHTPLHHAAIRGTPEVFELLLDRGADIEAIDNGTFTPLDYAVENENLKRSSILERLTATREPEPVVSESPAN
ncbi:MAG: ankyrin repeat domain-containing protein, partial [Hyphomicrobiales bacterium]|nr:ankyrin repeat domain-containing protein [Hyphomicrobiales bacterium]